MTYVYVTLCGILEYNRKVLRKTIGRKQNCLSSNCVKDIFVNCLRQNLMKFRATTNRTKIAFSVNRPLSTHNRKCANKMHHIWRSTQNQDQKI